MPLSLCHLDGTINKTVKSALTAALERQVEHGVPENVDVYLVDGFFLLHSMKQIPKTFRQLSMKILRQIINACPTAKAIYLVFDTYKNPSLKETEHTFRNTFSRDYCITGKNVNYTERKREWLPFFPCNNILQSPKSRLFLVQQDYYKSF